MLITDPQADFQTDFMGSERKHVLMLSTHGLHQWKIIPGIPDTGGQNIFVNQFSDALVEKGFRVTIVNRGGFRHPSSGRWQRGVDYKDAHQRILYVDDGLERFVRKEEMLERIPYLVNILFEHLNAENTTIDLVLSHYWDGAMVGEGYRHRCPAPAPHYWVPHSLGRIKKRNVSPDQHEALRIDERIDTEAELLQSVDGVIGTSNAIRTSLAEDYGYHGKVLFLPPCIDTDRFSPRKVSDQAEIWHNLTRSAQLPAEEIRNRRIISEISRTDSTKRKDLLIRSFAKIQKKHADTLLVISIDEQMGKLAQHLIRLIHSLQIRASTAIIGPIYDVLPDLYAVTDIYCTPSVMEGFGMSAQEAAATGVPVVASDRVPFAREYLLGVEPQAIFQGDGENEPVLLGKGAIVFGADDAQGLTIALDMLLSDDRLRKRMGESAFDLTIPYFTWSERVQDMLSMIDLTFP